MMKTDARGVAETGDAPKRAVQLPGSTIAKILLVACALWALYKLATVIALVLIAVVLAIALEPVVAWFERRGVPRWIGAMATVLVVVGCLVLFIGLCGSSLMSEGRQVVGRLGSAQKDLADRLPAPFGRIVRDESGSATPGLSSLAKHAMSLGSAMVSAVLGAAVAFILTIYLLIEGRRTWAWLVAYAPPGDRSRVRETGAAAYEAVLHYVVGNVATSIFAGVTVLVALTILRVPAALLLAVLAGVCDFVPVLGFIVSAVPAVLLALTVSPTTTILVAAVYIAYHMAENYLIGPKVYGDQLRLSNLAVLLAFAAGAALFGIIGALLALPAAAMYPCIEDIWLRDYLGRDAVETHRRIERS